MKVAFILVALVAASSSGLSGWRFGVEREVYPGHYATLLETRSGWQVWKLQNKYGLYCQAIKSGIGAEIPVPVGYGFSFYRGTPFIQIDLKTDEDGFSWYIVPSKFGGTVEWRVDRDKFWLDLKDDYDFSQFENKRIQFHAVSYRYPELKVGVVEEISIIDLTGITDAKLALRKCQRNAVKS